MNETTHLIGKYRGFGLFYDEEMDVFYSDLQEKYELKKEPRRGALKDLKKTIDETIKVNLNFKPFEAIFASIGWEEKSKEKRVADEVGRIVKILSVKKDGGLMVEKSRDYRSSQINGDDRLKLFVKDKESETITGEVAIIDAEIELLVTKKQKLYKKYKPLDLSFIDDYTK